MHIAPCRFREFLPEFLLHQQLTAIAPACTLQKHHRASPVPSHATTAKPRRCCNGAGQSKRRRRGHRSAQCGPRRACALKGQALGKNEREIERRRRDTICLTVLERFWTAENLHVERQHTASSRADSLKDLGIPRPVEGQAAIRIKSGPQPPPAASFLRWKSWKECSQLKHKGQLLAASC